MHAFKVIVGPTPSGKVARRHVAQHRLVLGYTSKSISEAGPLSSKWW